MKLDLELLRIHFLQAAAEDTVSSEGVNPYLLDKIIRPMLRGEKVTYGSIAYDQFEDVDLRTACGYCEDISRASCALEQLCKDVDGLQPSACKARAFC